jgi:hypothetical protein
VPSSALEHHTGSPLIESQARTEEDDLVKAELQGLIALQRTDTEIRRLEKLLQEIPEGRAAIEREFEQRAFEFRETETRRYEARTARAASEAELHTTRESLERAERNLMRSQNEKDYTAAIREADAARKQIATLETQILERMETIEKAEAEIAEHAPELERLQKELETNLQNFEKQTAEQTEQLAHLRSERERLERELPKSATTLYNRIGARIRDRVAVAEAKNGACTACLMKLRPQIMAQVRRGDEIVTCDNCNRILYYVPTT